jgi:hypothetical protein
VKGNLLEEVGSDSRIILLSESPRTTTDINAYLLAGSICAMAQGLHKTSGEDFFCDVLLQRINTAQIVICAPRTELENEEMPEGSNEKK